MNEVAVEQQREPDWRRLSFLSDKADVSPANLTANELHEFVQLYRKCSSDLALVRTKSNNLQLIDFLNDLVAKAYSSLYRSRRKPIGKAIGEAIALSARTVRKLRWLVVASGDSFLAAVLFGFSVMTINPDPRDGVAPPQPQPPPAPS